MGFMIEAVAEEKSQFAQNVLEITQFLMNLLDSLKERTDDPQALSIKETMAKIASFLKEDFQ